VALFKTKINDVNLLFVVDRKQHR